MPNDPTPESDEEFIARSDAWVLTDDQDWIDEVCDRSEDLVLRDVVYKLLRERDAARAEVERLRHDSRLLTLLRRA